MLTTAEQAALERLRHYHGADNYSQHHSYYRDLEIARDITLRAHPADADEPVTDEWLLLVGFVDRGVGELSMNGLCYRYFLRYGWQREVNGSQWTSLKSLTRGDVRALSQALSKNLFSRSY